MRASPSPSGGSAPPSVAARRPPQNSAGRAVSSSFRYGLPGDSQWRLHSPFATNQEFFSISSSSRRAASPRRCIPRQATSDGQRPLPNAARRRGGVRQPVAFYSRHPVVVCVSSTVGFEAATRGLPVICFGDASTPSPAVLRTARRLCRLPGACLGDAATRAPDHPCSPTCCAGTRRLAIPGAMRTGTSAHGGIALQHCRAAPGVVQSPTLQPDAWYVEPMGGADRRMRRAAPGKCDALRAARLGSKSRAPQFEGIGWGVAYYGPSHETSRATSASLSA